MSEEEQHDEVLDYIAALTGERYELTHEQAIQFASSLDHYHSEGYSQQMCEELTKQDMGL